jgi:predicted RNA binding protein YcfA (HicA-like mRNA interferase family)
VVSGFEKAVLKELRRLGYYRDGGSKHQKWCHKSRPTVTVPHSIVSKHTANGILKDAGSKVRF